MKTVHENQAAVALRGIAGRTRGSGHGPITRLMSPSDIGQIIKPFVFLDIFDTQGMSASALGNMPIHPHSGIATVTVFTKGSMLFNDAEAGTGSLGYGGVEWARAGGGMWHGKELTANEVPRIQGFQLWLALPPEVENGESVSRYVEAKDMLKVGPAHLIVGHYEGVQSPVPAPEGINYLLVTVPAGQVWTYEPPMGHTVAWLALAQGTLKAESTISAGEMVVFEHGQTPITVQASQEQDAVLVIGSAAPHPYPLHLGNYSVHTTAQALAAGERKIAELGQKLREAGNRKTATGTTPVFR
jgi:redox-sensitive bicupin YhaK (pirin superfamily)